MLSYNKQFFLSIENEINKQPNKLTCQLLQMYLLVSTHLTLVGNKDSAHQCLRGR